MTALRTSIWVIWLVFWVYWIVSAAGTKAGSRRPPNRPPGLIILALALVLAHIFKGDGLEIRSPALEALGTALFLAGLGLAVWARVNLGRNWGMPMTAKDEPELVTSGPYRFVRHPIYSGLLLATLGTALATYVYWLLVLVALGAYFIHSATVEEKLMSSSFPAAYGSYKSHTKMLIPFLL